MNFQKVIPPERKAKFEKLVLPGFDGVPISHVIPFVPIANFRQEMIRLFENILPANAYKFLETSIIDIVTKKEPGPSHNNADCHNYLLNKRDSCHYTCFRCFSPSIP